MKGFNEPELRPPGGSGLKRETSPESLFSFAQNPLEEHRVVNKKTEAYRTFRVVFIVDEPRVYRAPSAF